jgi:hypothetical protein
MNKRLFSFLEKPDGWLWRGLARITILLWGGTGPLAIQDDE